MDFDLFFRHLMFILAWDYPCTSEHFYFLFAQLYVSKWSFMPHYTNLMELDYAFSCWLCFYPLVRWYRWKSHASYDSLFYQRFWYLRTVEILCLVCYSWQFYLQFNFCLETFWFHFLENHLFDLGQQLNCFMIRLD